MAERELVAAILAAVLAANQKTAASDVKDAVATYHACLTELKNYSAEAPGARWSAAAENARLNQSDTKGGPAKP